MADSHSLFFIDCNQGDCVMGMDISIGEVDSKDYVSEKLGSNMSILIWKDNVRKKSNYKFKFVLNHPGERYEVNELHSLLHELNEIKKLNIEEYDNVINLSNKEVSKLKKGGIKESFSRNEILIVKSKNLIVDKFIKICKIAIEKQLPIEVSY